jgi:integrase
MEVEYHTGLRPGRTELFDLKWADIDMFTGMVKIYSSKTDRLHYQYVSEVFRARLTWRREALARDGELCDYVVSFEGKPIRSLKTVWGASKRRAGITRPLRLYDLRHFYASHALVRGANILELSDRLGHVNSDMVVKVYAHLADGIRSRVPLQIPELYPAEPIVTFDI